MNYDRKLRRLVSKYYGKEVSYEQVASVYYRAVCKLHRIIHMNGASMDYDIDYLAQLISEALVETALEIIYSGKEDCAYVMQMV